MTLDPSARFDALRDAVPPCDDPAEDEGDEEEDGAPVSPAVTTYADDETPVVRIVAAEAGQAPVRPPNAAGVAYGGPEVDKCFHLNPSWRGGVCTIQGNNPCPYLGGNCELCPHFLDRDTERARRRALPPHERARYASV